MLPPEAANAAHALVDAVREARRHLTQDEVIWRAVAYSEDPDEVGYWPTPEGRELADTVKRALEPCDAAADPDLPDATADGYAWPNPKPPTVLDEAQAAIYGDRQSDYGHPRENFTRTAILWQGLLHHKLADGEHVTPEDVGRCMIGVKLSRDVNDPKRDNRVDGAGYFACLDRLETGL